MAGAAPRDFTITYGSFSVGTGTSRPIDGRIRVRRSHDRFELEFAFLLVASSPATFASAVGAAEEAFRTPNQDLTVTGGDTATNANWYEFSQAAASGFDAEPEILKQESPADSGLSRRYTVRIRVALPADRLGTSSGRMGRRESTVSVAYDPSRRRTVTISGTYTAVTSGDGQTTARDQYEDRIDAYATAVLTAIGGSSSRWEVAEEPVTEVDDTDDSAAGKGRVIRFSRLYRELIRAQPAGELGGLSLLSDLELRDQRMNVRRLRDGAAAADGVPSGFDRFEVSYSCSVDHTKETNLRALYDSGANGGKSIRQFILDELESTFEVLTPTVREERVEFAFDENRIDAALVVGGIAAGPGLFGEARVDDRLEAGRPLVPVWSGDEFEKHRFRGPARRLRTITRTIRVAQSSGANPLPRGWETTYPSTDSRQVVSARVSHNFVRVDLRREDFSFRGQADVTQVVEIEYFSPPAQGTAIGEAIDDAGSLVL